MKTQSERIAVLETQLEQLIKSQNEIDIKLSQLLELRSKGVGAFWLASILLGTGIVGLFLKFTGWIKYVSS